MDWGEDHCSEASCGPSGYKILLRQPDVLAWKHLYRYTAGCHQHIDERTPCCWFLPGQDYYIGNRWYEKNKKKWAKDRALGQSCGYCCGGWGWWVNFDKGWAICKIGANPRDDKAGQTKGMLKSVKKCGVIKSIECRRHVESSQNCNFTRVVAGWKYLFRFVPIQQAGVCADRNITC